MIVDFPSQISWLAKFWVLNLCPRCFQLFRLQDSWKSNISRMSWGIVNFLYLNNRSIRLGLTRLCMLKVLRNYKSGIHSGERYTSYIILTSKNWKPNSWRNFHFPWVFRQKGPQNRGISWKKKFVVWFSWTQSNRRIVVKRNFPSQISCRTKF